jgi:hypothetical protein
MLSLAKLAVALRRVPGIAWVITLAVLIATVAAWSIFHAGVRHGEVKVQRAAVADSIVHVTAKLDSARARSDTLIRKATVAKVTSDSGRAVTRAVIEAHLLETPPAVVQAVNAQLERDSLAITAHVAPIIALVAERPIEEKRDSLRVNQVAIGVPARDSHWKQYVVGGALLGGGLVLTILHFVR